MTLFSPADDKTDAHGSICVLRKAQLLPLSKKPIVTINLDLSAEKRKESNRGVINLHSESIMCKCRSFTESCTKVPL